MEKYPHYLARGARLSLVFRRPVESGTDLRVLDHLLADFHWTSVVVDDAIVLFLHSRERAASREAVDQLVQQACRIEHTSGFRLTGALTTDAREIQRAAAAGAAQHTARERADREAERRRAADARASLRAVRRSPPTPDELNDVLRAQWGEVIANQPTNSVTDGRFSRVRDVQCRRRDGFFRCRVGVLGLSERGPEYEQLELDFNRLDDGSVVYQPPQIIITDLVD